MSDLSDEHVLDRSKGLVSGLLGFCSAAVLALAVVEARSTFLTIAIGCFAFTLPLLGLQFLDFYRPDRHIYNLGSKAGNIVGGLMMVVPAVGLCAVVAHVSSVLGGLFMVWSIVWMTIFVRPSAKAQRDKDRAQYDEAVRARYKSQPAKTLYVTDADEER